MQKIIDEVRGKLSGFLTAEENSNVSAAAFYGANTERLINKIPSRNYTKLSKLVPISWL